MKPKVKVRARAAELRVNAGPLLLRISNMTTGKGKCIVGFHWSIQKIDNPIITSVT